MFPNHGELYLLILSFPAELFIYPKSVILEFIVKQNQSSSCIANVGMF